MRVEEVHMFRKMSLKNKIILFVLPIIFIAPATASALLVYDGLLSAPVGIDGTGDWATNFKIIWHIGQQADLSWNYTYSITELGNDPDPIATSHFTLEISTAATEHNFSHFNGDSVEFGTIDDTGFGAPATLNAVKLDYEDSEYTFSSDKGPVWGDFVAKGGRAECCGPANQRPFNTAWNADFILADPNAAPQNGLLSNGQGGYIYKILRPDTISTVGSSSPEPSTMALLGIGLTSILVRRRRKTAA